MKTPNKVRHIHLWFMRIRLWIKSVGLFRPNIGDIQSGEALISTSTTLVANPKHSKLEDFGSVALYSSMHGTCLLICEHEAGMNVVGLGSRPLST